MEINRQRKRRNGLLFVVCVHYREFVCAVPIRPAWPGRPAGRARPGRAFAAPNPKPLFDFAHINSILTLESIHVYIYRVGGSGHTKREREKITFSI